MDTCTDAPRAVIYLRQSLDPHDDQNAVDRQRADCERLAGNREWRVMKVLTDNDKSASNGKPRPGYLELLRRVDAGEVDVIVVAHVDRLVRRLADLEDVIDRCERAQVKLATVSGDLDLSTDAGRLVGRILASVARGEVERKGARQRRAAVQRAERGEPSRSRNRLFGYATDGVTVIDAEADAIREACRSLLAGGSLSGITRAWNTAGLDTPQAARRKVGTGWTVTGVRQLLVNPRLAGLATYHREEVGPGSWEPIVPEDSWRAVRALLEDPSRAKRSKGVRTLLGGLVLCPCGKPAFGSRDSASRARYACRAGARGVPGPHVARNAAPVDAYICGGTLDGEDVAGLVVERLSRPDAAELLIDDDRPDVDALRADAKGLRTRLDDLAADYADGVLSRSQLRAGTERINAKLAEVDDALSEAARVDVLSPIVGADDVAAMWAALGLDRKRAVIDRLMTVILHSPGRGPRRFDPDTVTVAWRAGS